MKATDAKQLLTDKLVEIAERINTEHTAVGQSISTGLDHARKAGELLLEAKTLIAHGAWLPWLAGNCSVAERTAQAYMRIARNYSELAGQNPQRVADLCFRDGLKLLAEQGPVTPVDWLRRLMEVERKLSTLAEVPIEGQIASISSMSTELEDLSSSMNFGFDEVREGAVFYAKVAKVAERLARHAEQCKLRYQRVAGMFLNELQSREGHT